MKVYVSSHCIFAARYALAELTKAKHTVISIWHDGPANATRDLLDHQRTERAHSNLARVANCDALVLIASQERVPGGKFVEAGFALGHGKPVLVLGHVENLLLWHPAVKTFPEMSGLLSYLGLTEAAGRVGK